MTVSGAVGDRESIYLNPLSAALVREYAGKLRGLLRALDREVIETALIGDCEGDLLNPEREEVNRLRELLDGRILVPLELDGRRSRGLALLDTFANEIESCTGHGAEPTAEGEAAS